MRRDHHREIQAIHGDASSVPGCMRTLSIVGGTGRRSARICGKTKEGVIIVHVVQEETCKLDTAEEKLLLRVKKYCNIAAGELNLAASKQYLGRFRCDTIFVLLRIPCPPSMNNNAEGVGMVF